MQIVFKNQNKNKNKQRLFSSSSMDIKVSSSSLSLFDSQRNKKKKIYNNNISRKNTKKNDNDKINYNTNFNQEFRKYLSFTPGPGNKTNSIKNKKSSSNNSEDKKRKEDIITIFENEFKCKMLSRKPSNKSNNKNKNNSSNTNISRNKSEENKKNKNSKSYKNITKNKKNQITKNELDTLNLYERKTFPNGNNNISKDNYEKYRSLLESKIHKLNEDIKQLKKEEKNLSMQLIDYKEMENSCIEVRKIREDIDKYKVIIEKAIKTCEEYDIEIKKIKNIIGEDNNNGL